jgi:hypothetical protein
MPLVRFDFVEGRNENEIKQLLDAAHRASFPLFTRRKAIATKSDRSVRTG